MRRINTIVGLENVKDWYFITTCGNIISTKGKIKILNATIDGNGYKKINLRTTNGKPKTIRVHRLVALAFIPNPNNKPDVNHKDEIKTNNCIRNLEWATKSENVNYGTRNEKAREAMKGRHHTEETKKKMSNARKGKLAGEKNPMYGIRGSMHPNSKSKKYYETNAVLRSNFKRTCKKQKWNFDDFTEIYSGEKRNYIKKYYYIYNKK